MEIHLPYKMIRDDKQYVEYCKTLHGFLVIEKPTENELDIIDLLTVLIEAYDRENDDEDEEEPDPVSYLKFVMEQNRMKAADLAKELGVSKSLVSDILNYRRGFSKAFIRKLGKRFSFRESLWNRPYKLIAPKTKETSKSAKPSKSSKTSKVSKASKSIKAKAVKSAKPSRSSKPTHRIQPSKSSKTKVA